MLTCFGTLTERSWEYWVAILHSEPALESFWQPSLSVVRKILCSILYLRCWSPLSLIKHDCRENPGGPPWMTPEGDISPVRFDGWIPICQGAKLGGYIVILFRWLEMFNLHWVSGLCILFSYDFRFSQDFPRIFPWRNRSLCGTGVPASWSRFLGGACLGGAVGLTLVPAAARHIVLVDVGWWL